MTSRGLMSCSSTRRMAAPMFSGLGDLFGVFCRERRAAGEGHTESLGARGHGVGGVHATTGTGTGAGVAHGVVADLFGIGGAAVGEVLAVGLEGGNNVERAFDASASTGSDGAAIKHNTRSVETTERHEDTGHVLIATGDDDTSIEPVTTAGGLDRVGDEIARRERVGHGVGAHRDTVRDTDGAELVAGETSFLNGLFDALRDGEEMCVAGLPSYQMEPIPTMARVRSSSVWMPSVA